MPDKQKCFAVMGFGQKTDYRTSRTLDLDKTYRHIIKPAVEAAGLECVRADEIAHSGTIDVPMYENLLDADLVVADLSTSNVNAAYELGVRHALRPHTTIIIAENQFDFPFDVNHVSIHTYEHHGKALDIDVVEQFREELRELIEDVMANANDDSPVYTFLKPLRPPARDGDASSPDAAPDPAEATTDPTLAVLMDQAMAAKDSSEWIQAKTLLAAALALAPRDHYVTQQLALATYKSESPDAPTALVEAKEILETLDPMTSNDAETLGLWGAIHKRIYAHSGARDDLDSAIAAHEKGYRLLNDYYNGINFAYLLNVRSAISESADRITDFVLARRTRDNVLTLCDAALAQIEDKTGDEADEDRYWISATKVEALFGLGRADETTTLFDEIKVGAKDWMINSTQDQLDKLGELIRESPLDLLDNP